MSGLRESETHGSRRDFLATIAAATLAGGLAPTPGRGAEPAGNTRLLPDTPRDLSPTRADMGTLFPDLSRLAEHHWQAKPRLLDSTTPQSWETTRQTFQQKVLEVLQYQPAKVDPRPEVLDRVDCGDHIREKVLFSTTPLFRVPAYVLIPRNLRDKAPAIVDLHSHGGMFLFGKEKVVDLGSNHPAMTSYHERNYDGRPTATALVKRGYAVISIDAFMFGERRVLLDADHKYGWDRSKYSLDDVKHLNQQCRSKESTLVKSLTVAGGTWPGIVFWDDMRTIDYLITRPEVDPQRIGCLGISMGGYRALYLSALDPRIQAGCVAGFMSTVKPMLQAHIDTHSWVHFLPGLHQVLDWPEVAALTAPRALLVQQCQQDRLFPLEGMQQSLEQIAALYQKAGFADRFTGQFFDVPHMLTRPMQDAAFAWFDARLQHRPR